MASAVISDAVEAATNGLSIYPNPVNDILHIKGLQKIINYELLIIDGKGNVVSVKEINNTAVCDYNVKGLYKGVYYINVSSAYKTIFSTKFLKE